MLYISCDSIFSPSPAPASESRPDDPASATDNQTAWYKALSERAVLAAGGSDVGVLRVPPLLGPLEKIGESCVTVLAKLVFPRVKAGEKVDDTVVRYPVSLKSPT